MFEILVDNVDSFGYGQIFSDILRLSSEVSVLAFCQD